jgi:hypothetical protein
VIPKQKINKEDIYELLEISCKITDWKIKNDFLNISF